MSLVKRIHKDESIFNLIFSKVILIFIVKKFREGIIKSEAKLNKLRYCDVACAVSDHLGGYYNSQPFSEKL